MSVEAAPRMAARGVRLSWEMEEAGHCATPGARLQARQIAGARAQVVALQRQADLAGERLQVLQVSASTAGSRA